MKTIKILSIGNSFADDAESYLYDILKSAGYTDIVVANLYIGGCSLETHSYNIFHDLNCYCFRKNNDGLFKEYYNYSVKKGLEEENWDYITMQQASWASGLKETYLVNNELINTKRDNYVDYIIDYVKSVLKKDCPILWHMTWSYQKDFQDHAFENYDFKQNKMNEMIEQRVKDFIIKNPRINDIIPSFYTINNLRKDFGDMLTRDGYHLSMDIGRFAASMTYFYALTKKNMNLVEYTPSCVSAFEKDSIKEAVLNAINQKNVLYSDIS